MMKVAIFVAFLALAAAKPQRMFEKEITRALRSYLAPYDPLTVDVVSDINIVTDHSEIVFGASDVNIDGLTSIVCTSFAPPIPFITTHFSTSIRFGELAGTAPSYSMTGTFDEEEYESTGLGELTISGLAYKVDFRVTSYSLSDPFYMCIKKGTLRLQVSAEDVVAAFEGADDVNDDINNNYASILGQIEDQLNAKAPELEDAFNAALCNV